MNHLNAFTLFGIEYRLLSWTLSYEFLFSGGVVSYGLDEFISGFAYVADEPIWWDESR